MENTLSVLHRWLDTPYDQLLQGEENKLKAYSVERALSLFHRAARDVPAYKKFLKKKKCDPESVKEIGDFANVPVTTKKNYIDCYKISERCWGGKIENASIISTSSGTTGAPYLWPRDMICELEGAQMHEYIFENAYNIFKKRTLLINGFAMGNWIAGTFTLACCQWLNFKGYKLTCMTPGYSLAAVEETIKSTIQDFDQLIITGHTPFLKELAELISERNLNLDGKIMLLGTGQAITNSWRKYTNNLLGALAKKNSIMNLYGSADAALMGFETNVSIEIQEKFDNNIESAKRFFGDERIPSLYNYDPRFVYFESVDHELVLTKYSAAPLIRYNLHDTGGVLSARELSKFSSSQNVLPFIYLFGREKFMVKLYGANIYSEHMQAAFTHHSVQEFITGRYKPEVIYDDKNNQILVCRIELRKGVHHMEELRVMLRDIFIEEVRKLNSEYDFVYKSMGEAVHPRVELYQNGHPIHFPEGVVRKSA